MPFGFKGFNIFFFILFRSDPLAVSSAAVSFPFWFYSLLFFPLFFLLLPQIVIDTDTNGVLCPSCSSLVTFYSFRPFFVLVVGASSSILVAFYPLAPCSFAPSRGVGISERERDLRGRQISIVLVAFASPLTTIFHSLLCFYDFFLLFFLSFF